MRGKLVALGVAVLLLAGCGDQRPEPVRSASAPVGATGPTGPTGPSGFTAPSASPTDPVRAYYRMVDARRFEQAWSRLTPVLHGSLGGYESWRRGYRLTVGTRLLSAQTVSQHAGRATVAVRFSGEDIDACADRVTQVFAGRWDLERAGHRWLPIAVRARKIAGGDPVRYVSDCPELRHAPSAPPSYGAPPSYSAPPSPGYTPPGSNIPNYEYGQGYRVQCADGSYSHSGGRQGACSWHGGVAP